MDFGLSHLRALKQSEVAKSRCFRKSDADEISLIEDVLGRMTDLDSDSQQNDDSQSLQSLLLRILPMPCVRIPWLSSVL